MSSFDITFCANKECRLRKNCERNTDRLKDYPYPVSMAGFTPDENGECDHYCPLDDKPQCDLYGKACATCHGCDTEQELEREENEEDDDIFFDRDANGVVTIGKNQEL